MSIIEFPGKKKTGDLHNVAKLFDDGELLEVHVVAVTKTGHLKQVEVKQDWLYRLAGSRLP